jgi:hypothetical protein
LLLASAASVPAFAAAGSRDKYILFCAGCHGFDGEGGGGGGGMKRITAFTPNIGVFLNDRQGRTYLANVGGVTSAGMSDADAAEVLNYVLLTFGKSTLPASFVPFTREELRELRSRRVDDPLAIRRQIAVRLLRSSVRLPPYEWE